MKKFITGLICGILIAASFTIYANEQLKLVINGIDVSENAVFTPQIIDGEVVAPVSVVAEALGAVAEFNAETNTMTVTTPKPIIPVGDVGTRLNPIPFNSTVVFDSMSKNYSAYKVELTLTEVIRGKEAWDIIYEANMFNTQPNEGQEYILVKFKVKALDSKDDEKINISVYDFDFVSGAGVKYVMSAASGLKTQFTDLYTGGEMEGYVSKIINIGDNPVIVFRENIEKGLWFSTDLSSIETSQP